jgi:hypothetical protein
MDIKEIEAVFKKFSPEEVVGSIAKNSKGYVVYLTRPNLKDGEWIEDNLYFMDEKKNIKSFNPADNRELYREGLKNIIYKRPGL